MLGKNLRLPVKIGNRTGNFDDPVIAPGRQVQLFEYFMKQFSAFLIKRAGLLQLPVPHLCIVLHMPFGKS